MSDNDLSSKLSKGVRRAKEPAAKEKAGGPVAATSGVVREPALATEASAVKGNPSTARPSGPKRFAEQGDQAPPASLDSPWKNLHPKRIWPD